MHQSKSYSNYKNSAIIAEVDLDFENAVNVLYSLRTVRSVSKTQGLPNADYSSLVEQTEKYILRADIPLELLDTLSVIHVSGTKGKGSTCALCESILRHHGYRTGLFSSPHLIDVRERISINGLAISKQDFSNTFWQIYNKLDERRCGSFEIIEPLRNLSLPYDNYPKDIFNLNANLAVALSQAWINYRNKLQNSNAAEIEDILIFEATTLGLSKFTWPGRYQIVHNDSNSFYIDGAHTYESLKICTEWFNSSIYTSTRKRALIFNLTGGRNPEYLLKLLTNCKFNKVLFVPNRAFLNCITDTNNSNAVEDEELIRCYNHKKIWMTLDALTKTVKVLPSVSDALDECSLNYNILITGSLHLVGAALHIISSGFKKNT